MLRAYWLLPEIDCRVSSDVFVPVGESDGLPMVLPDVSCWLSRLYAVRLEFRPARLFCATARWVIRIIVYVTAPC